MRDLPFGVGLKAEQMRVYLISSMTLHREGLAEVLARRDGIELVGTSADPNALPLTMVAAPGAERTIIVLDAGGLDVAEVAPRLVLRNRAEQKTKPML